MPAPPPYQRQANFKNAQALVPSGQPSGVSMDAEFDAVKATLDAILGRLPSIQRDDGRVANQSITIDQLSPSLSVGFTLRGLWKAGVNYNTGDGAVSGLKFFRALVANLSSAANSPPVSPATWEEIVDLSELALIIMHPAEAAIDGTAGAPGIGFASQVLGFFRQAASVIGVSIAGVQSFLLTAAGIVLPADPVLALHAATKQYVDVQITAAIAPAIATAVAGDIGIVKWFPASVLPANHVLCYGQALSRSLPLFGVFGTVYGVGDGSTTFNNIDMRGIVPAGVDNMGGTAANRLTGTTITGGAETVGNIGGLQTHVLTTAQLAAHAHGVTDPGHNHAINDSGHTHTYTSPGTATNATAGGVNVASTPFGTTTGNSTTGITINNKVTSISVNSVGSGSAHNNVQPTRVGNWIVRTQ